ncbi:MAG: GH1 family beta-glucosidase [Ferruginibacter sp.]
MSFSRNDFGDDFKWGVSTAAYQIEGAHNIHGKGPSVWDEFVKKRGRIFKGQHANSTCDFYNRYEDDNRIIKELNIPNHRFSISWSRILPEGTGRVNLKGIDFYNRLIDHSLELGIEPWITLYHWDLPYALHQEGGWTNRDIIGWFSYYVEQCIKYFGDRVKNWIVLNEPMVFTGAGYFFGVHAPGKKGLKNFLAAVHHAALCQAEGGRMLRELNGPNIGTTFSCSHVEPYRCIDKDIAAAKKADVLLNRLFIEPLLGMGYPMDDLKILRSIEQFVKQGDEAKLAFDMDFIGVQNYTRELVKHSAFMPFVKARIVKANKRNVETTLMNWEVYPESMYYILKKFSGYKNIRNIIVTENGAAFNDQVVGGKVDDQRRMLYLRENILQLLRAKKEGVNVNGYFVWTLLDNFEWAEGYYPKFGLVHVDFETQKRIIKSSGYWYKEFLSGF